jgi:hypothetical protein
MKGKGWIQAELINAKCLRGRRNYFKNIKVKKIDLPVTMESKHSSAV